MSTDAGLIGKNEHKNINVACGIDINKYEKQIENITNLKTKIIFKEKSNNYYEHKVQMET